MRLSKKIIYGVSAFALQSNISSAEVNPQYQDVIETSSSQCGEVLDTSFTPPIDRESFCKMIKDEVRDEFGLLNIEDQQNPRKLKSMLNNILTKHLSSLIKQSPEFYIYISGKYLKKNNSIDFRTMLLEEFGLFLSPYLSFVVGDKINIDTNDLFRDIDSSSIKGFSIGEEFFNLENTQATAHKDTILIRKPINHDYILNELGHIFLHTNYDFGPLNQSSLSHLDIGVGLVHNPNDLQVHEIISDVFSLKGSYESIPRLISLLCQSIVGSDIEKEKFVYGNMGHNGGYNYTTQFILQQLDKIYGDKGMSWFHKIHELHGAGYLTSAEKTEQIMNELDDDELEFIRLSYLNQGDIIVGELDRLKERE